MKSSTNHIKHGIVRAGTMNAMARCACAVVFLALVALDSVRGEETEQALIGTNLLANPSFEDAASGLPDAPAAWQISTIFGDGPNLHEWIAEAHTGQRALRLHSMHVTEYLLQKVAVTEKQSLAFTVHARGAGRFNMAIRVYVRGKDGTIESRAVTGYPQWSTTNEWLPYTITGTTPPGTEGGEVFIGTPRHGCNIIIDDASLSIVSATIVKDATSGTKSVPPAARRAVQPTFNLMPFCSVQSDPYALGTTTVLADNDFTTKLSPEFGPSRGARIVFRLPQPARLATVRFVQTDAAAYLVEADSDGDGVFERTLSRVDSNAPENTWIEHSCDPQTVSAVRLTGLVKSGSWAEWDCGSFPELAEMQLLAVREAWMENLRLPSSEFSPRAPVRIDPVAQFGSDLAPAPNNLDAPLTDRTARGVFIAPWMLGWNPKKPNEIPPAQMAEVADDIRRLGANFVVLFFETNDPVLWSSQAVHGIAEDVLPAVTAAFAARSIRVFPLFGSGVKPIADKQPWPEWHGNAMAEAVARGCQGFSVCADEFPQCGGTPDPVIYASAMKEELGLDAAPLLREDSENYRKFLLWHYRQVGIFHRQAAERALSAKSSSLLLSSWRIDPIGLNSTYDSLAYDLLARETKVDFMSTDPYYTDPSRRTFMERCVKLLAAANRPRGALPILQAGQWHQLDRLEDWKNIVTGGSALAAVMHGAAGVAFYRHNYLELNANTHWAAEAFSLIGFLDRYGLRASREPKNVAVLHSRASEDFWQLRCRLTDRGDPLADGIRGYVTQKIVEEALLERSVPSKFFYLENEEELEKELKGYPVILLPFPYCISDRALKAVDAARVAGSKVVICDRLGEANELGTLRPEPAFAAWKTAKQAAFVEDIPGTFWEPKAQQILMDLIQRRLGEKQALSIDAGGRNVEAIVRVAANNVVLMAIINWEDEPAEADVCLRVPTGTYSVIMADKYGSRPAGVLQGRSQESTGAFLWASSTGGAAKFRTALTASDLAHFTVAMPRQSMRVFVVFPAR